MHNPHADDRWAVSIPELGRRLDISRATAYRLVAAGEISSVRLGHRRVVPLAAIERLLEGTRATEAHERRTGDGSDRPQHLT